MIARRTGRVFLLVALIAGGAACAGGESGGTATRTAGDSAAAPLAAADTAPPRAARSPVRVGDVRIDTLRLTVAAPGRTDVLRDHRVRAPFAGTLTSLSVTDGDRVRSRDVLGTIVAQSSEAATDGALAMLTSATTPGDSADARRALDLARMNHVERAFRAPESAVVLSHSASPGDRLAEGDEIVRLAAVGSSIFLADAAQNELADVRPGQPAQVELPAVGRTLDGIVHGVLPAASGSAFSAPVRVDFRHVPEVPTVGLFGTVTITVGTRRDVLSVPEAAILTDDVTGISRVAIVAPKGDARWIVVRTGLRDRGRVEVAGAGLVSGDWVIVSGQVGLPEGTLVVVTP